MSEDILGDTAEPIFRFVTVRDPQLIPTLPLPRIDVRAAADLDQSGGAPILAFAEAPGMIVALNSDLLLANELADFSVASVVLAKWANQVDPGWSPGTGSAEQASEKFREMLTDERFLNQRGRCARGLLHAMSETAVEIAARPELMRILQLYALIDWVADHDRAKTTAADIRRLVEGALVLVPSQLADYRSDVSVSDDSSFTGNGADDGDGADPIPVGTAGVRETRVLERISSAALPVTLAQSASNPRLEEAQRYEKAADDLVAVLTKVTQTDGELTRPELPSWRLTAPRRRELSAETRTLLIDAGLDAAASIVDAVEELRAKAADLYDSVVQPTADQTLVRNRRALAEGVMRMSGLPGATPTVLAKRTAILARPPRIGDLEVVRQELVRYEKGELAHVENVMPGEFRQRHHRVVDLSETEEIEIDEREEETTQENATTSRSELSNEMSRVANQDSTLQAGGSITARYGPWVEASANIGYTSSNSTSTSERRAQSYASEMTERAATTIRQRVMRTQRRLTRRQVTESNTHRFDNREDNPAVGYYRWLNKRYRAQVFNLGQRVLLDLVIPDPALNYRYASALGAGVNVDIDAPPEFVQPGTSDALRPEHVTPLTWKGLAARFRAGTVEPPPPELLASTMAAQSTKPPELRLQSPVGAPDSGIALATPHQAFSSEAMMIPPGYRPLVWNAAIVHKTKTVLLANVPPAPLAPAGEYDLPGSPTVGVLAVGTTVSPFTAGTFQVGGYFTESATSPAGMPALSAPDEEELSIPIAVAAAGPIVLSVNVVAVSVRSRAVLERWQMETFAALQTAHAAWDAEFRAAVRGAEIGRGVAIQGSNPLENARTISTELKRTAIQMLGGPSPEALVAADPGDATAGTEPSIDAALAQSIGSDILFWEQAFEWENMTSLFYPYFWTGRDDWPQQSRLRDTDPSFAEFLRAGASRITIPVRPGYERPVGLRLSLTLPNAWMSDPAPTVNTEPWLSIAEETRLRQDQSTGRPIGTPWPVILPTTLVCLEQTEPIDLFHIEDELKSGIRPPRDTDTHTDTDKDNGDEDAEPEPTSSEDP